MANNKHAQAVFAGGCFWCMEPPFEKLDGVQKVISGYTGGKEKSPTYQEVASGKTAHLEAVQVLYDPGLISYAQLVAVFWQQIDPTDDGGQFVDRGRQYRPAIFYQNNTEKLIAETSRETLEKSGRFEKPILTAILPFTNFYPAEDYHQDYYKENPVRYRFYRSASGRDSFIQKHWSQKELESRSEPSSSAASDKKYLRPENRILRKQLSPLQWKVTQKDATEPPFRNEFWDKHEPGIYVDVVSGEPLFSSIDKFISGTGWPSFVRPIDPKNIVERTDSSLFTTRTEVRSKHGNSHLGHVFTDGPKPTGLRYCINSASLRFVPEEDLETEGYGEYRKLFVR